MTEFTSNITKFGIKDALTNELFIPKRYNQRFSCRENQIKFNNLKAKKLREKTSFVNKPLQKNFKILEELLTNKKENTFHKEFLLGKGFSFEVNTGINTFDKKDCFSIYNYSIIPINNDTIKIIKP